MSQPSNQDIQAPFDPTAYTNITAGEILQLTAGASPFTDKGLVVITTDVAGVPQVPTANITTKWQNYIWLRVSPTTTSASLYVWNPNIASDATYLNWQTAFSAAISPGSIQGYMIAAATITKDKIVSVDLSQVNGSSSLLTSSSQFTGIISGSQGTGLTIEDDSITTAMIQLLAITTAQIAAGAVTLAKFDTTGTIGQILGNPVANTPSWITKYIVSGLANPDGGGANDGNVVAVNSGAAGTFKYLTPAAVVTAGNAAASNTFSVSAASIMSAGTPNIAATAHGLGAIPTIVRVVAKCTTAYGTYLLNDEIDITNIAGAGQYPSIGCGSNATNVWAYIDGAIYTIDNTGSSLILDKTKWTLKVYCRL